MWHRQLRRFALFATLALAASAHAQSTVSAPYRTDFEHGAGGWTLQGLWHVDASPASVAGGAAYSGDRSLNFNDGRGYPGVQRAACQSPTIRASAMVEHVLRFRCNYVTETLGPRFDRRRVRVRVNGRTVLDEQLASTSGTPAPARCAAMGVWHTHELRIPAPSATRSFFIQVEFVFDSVDDMFNDFPGWFIDDVELNPAAPAAAPFDLVQRSTLDFRDLSTTTIIDANRDVLITRSQPNVRFAPVRGRVTDAEWRALTGAVRAARLASVPGRIPDPNTYVVRPTSFRLEVRSRVRELANTVEGHLGVYGRWDAQVRPLMEAIAAIEQRVLGSAGGAPGGDDHGDSPQAATVVPIEPAQPPVAGTIDPPGDVDWFRLQDTTPVIAIYPPPQRTYVFETSVQGGMDTVIELYAADGATLLATNDDAAGLGLGSRLRYTAPHGTVFYLKVRHYSPAGTGSYVLRAGTANGAPAAGGDDHANTPAGATALTIGDPPRAGAIETPGDVDWFRFDTVAAAIYPPPQLTYVIETSVQGNMDTVIELYTGDGATLLATNDDAPGLGLASRIVYTGPAGQSYRVKVRHYSASGTGAYTIAVQTQP